MPLQNHPPKEAAGPCRTGLGVPALPGLIGPADLSLGVALTCFLPRRPQSVIQTRLGHLCTALSSILDRVWREVVPTGGIHGASVNQALS